MRTLVLQASVTSAWRGEARDFRKQIESHADRERDVDQIGVVTAGARSSEKASSIAPRDCASRSDFGRSQPEMWMSGGVFAQRQRERAADQAGAKDGDAAE